MQRLNVITGHVVAALAPAPCAATAEGVAREMAPTGKLRVALNMRNQLLVSGKTPDGEPDGLAPGMARAFAEKLGVAVEFVPYDNAAKLAEDAASDKWDLGMIGADPDRATHIDFTPPYCQIEATYAVPTTSGAQKCADVDKANTTIATCAGAAYTLWLERNIKNATVEKIEGHDETYAHFKENGLEAVAGLRSKLKKDASKRPATRLLKDKFMAVEQAMATKKGRTQGFKALTDFVAEAKKSGLVKQLMSKHKVDKDLSIP